MAQVTRSRRGAYDDMAEKGGSMKIGTSMQIDRDLSRRQAKRNQDRKRATAEYRRLKQLQEIEWTAARHAELVRLAKANAL